MKMGYLNAAGIGCAALLSGATGAWAQTSEPLSDSERIQRLEVSVRQLQTEKEDLQRQVEALKQVSAPPITTDTNFSGPISRWGTNLLSYVVPAGKENILKLGGFIQGNADFGDVGSSSGDFSDNPTHAANHVPLHNRFRLRRARINLTGDFYEKFDFKMEGDFTQTDGTSGNRSDFSATDIFINWHQFAEANIKFGQYKVPFGWEQTTPDTTLFTIERSLPTGALTPERQVGVQVWGKPLAQIAPERKDLVDYAVGIFNGNGRNITINDDPYYMYVGRLVVTPLSTKICDQPLSLRIGGDVMKSRYASGTRISPSDNLLMSQVDGSLSAFNAPGPAESVGWDVNSTLTYGPFDLIVEYLEQDISPKDSPSFKEFVANGYYIQGSYFLPGKKLQLVAKWISFNPGQTAEDEVNSMLGGINYYIKGDNIKLMFNYIHTWSEFRNTHPGTGDDQFNEFFMRLQLMF